MAKKNNNSPFKREETLNRTWLIKGDLPAKYKLGKGRKEEEDGAERMEDRERRDTNMLAVLDRTKYFNSNYLLAGELRI